MREVQHVLRLNLRQLQSIDHQKTFVLLRQADLMVMYSSKCNIPSREKLAPGLILATLHVVCNPWTMPSAYVPADRLRKTLACSSRPRASRHPSGR